MLKQYSSTAHRFTINVFIDDKQVPVKFDIKDPIKNVVMYRTSDENIQKQLEKSADFNNYFELDWAKEEVEKAKKEPKKTEEEVEIDIPERTIEVSTVQEAKKYLNEKEDIPFSRLRNKELVDAEAAKIGLTFKYPEE